MFICNFKINGKKTAKIVIIITIILAIIILGFSILKIYKTSKSEHNDANEKEENTVEIANCDYTNFLKDCHEHIDDYVGKKVKITGYVYRINDFNNNQFVLSRTMIIAETNSAVVVGILSEYENAPNFADGDWITVTGNIKKGNYKGEMPILEVTEIKKCEKPEDEYVYSPSA